MEPAGVDVLQRWPVSKRVNSSRADDAEESLIGIEGSIATSDEIMSATNWLAREHRRIRISPLAGGLSTNY